MSLESINRLAELTGRTRRTVKDRVKNLTPVKDGKTLMYESSEAIPLIYDLNEKANPQKEMARFNRIRADRGEFDLAVVKSEYESIAVLTYALSRIAELINSVLDSLPLRLKKQSPKLTARDIENIRRVVVKMQNEISEIDLDTNKKKDK